MLEDISKLSKLIVARPQVQRKVDLSVRGQLLRRLFRRVNFAAYKDNVCGYSPRCRSRQDGNDNKGNEGNEAASASSMVRIHVTAHG